MQAVTPIKNQGQCGSCWAFSTTGSLEGAYFLKTGELKSFSEQQLVDCDTKQDQGCNGGLMDNAFDFIKTNKGLCTEESYPYKGVDGTCNKKCKDDSKATVKTHTDVAANAKALMSAIAKQPVSIAIEADQSSFQFYKSGVFNNAGCGTQLDHGVLAVGYGTLNGTDYWKVKNSWGATWGLNGYILLAKGTTAKPINMCGISQSASYPTGVSIFKRRRSNVAVIIVRIVFISSFLFYCLFSNHSFPTNPNSITNCFKLILSIATYNYIAPASLFDF